MDKSLEEAAGREGSRGRDIDEVPLDTPRRLTLRPKFKAIFQFARFMVTLPVVLVRGRRGNIDEVTVYSAPVALSEPRTLVPILFLGSHLGRSGCARWP